MVELVVADLNRFFQRPEMAPNLTRAARILLRFSSMENQKAVDPTIRVEVVWG